MPAFAKVLALLIVWLLAGGGATADPSPFPAVPINEGSECRTDADCPVPCMHPGYVCLMNRCKQRTPPTLETCDADWCRGSCTSDHECRRFPNGHCVPFRLDYCGGAAPLAINECRYDVCTSDAECTEKPNGFCSDGYPRRCVYGPCRTSADCTRSAGGQCVMDTVHFPCPQRAVFCRYANDPCRLDSDCKPDPKAKNGMLCAPNEELHGTQCIAQPPPLPSAASGR